MLPDDEKTSRLVFLFAALLLFPTRVAAFSLDNCCLGRRVNFELGESYWSQRLLNARRREQLLIPGIAPNVLIQYERIHNKNMQTYCPDVW